MRTISRPLESLVTLYRLDCSEETPTEPNFAGIGLRVNNMLEDLAKPAPGRCRGSAVGQTVGPRNRSSLSS